MKISSVNAVAIDVGFQKQTLQTSRIASPMARWPRFAERRSSWMWPTKRTFVRIESADGKVGWSCTNGGEITTAIVRDHLARIVEGSEISGAAGIGETWDQMVSALLPHGTAGFSMMAVAGVDIALWDLFAKTEDRSLVELLGGAKHKTLASYITTNEPEAHATEGWWGLKAAMPYGLEAGAQGLAANVATMQRFRDVAGPKCAVMLDAYMAWDADYTLRFADAARDLDLYWIEDPLPPHDLEGLRQIRAQGLGRIRLALGNFCFSRWDCAALLREQLVDVLQPDVAWAGGITECRRILAMAAAANVPVILHNTFEQPWALALAATERTAPIVEFVDRGPQSELYSLMGEEGERAHGRVAVPLSRMGHRPPTEVLARFDAQPAVRPA
jgi:L-rhamnonate dehydratase